jgi:septal ring factor EnvC (AmiA/AmiB activator)
MDYLEAVVEDLTNTGLGTRELERHLEDQKQKQDNLQKDIAELLTELDEGTAVVNEFQVSRGS